MTIFGDRIDQAAGRRAGIGPGAFPETPAEIEARLGGRHHIDFFDRTLADVTYDQGRSREGKTERIAQAGRVDIAVAAAGQIGIARGGRQETLIAGNRCTRIGVFDHPDPQYLAEPRIGILGVITRITRAPAIAHPDIEQAVGAKGHRAAIMVVRPGMRYRKPRQHTGRSGECSIFANLDVTGGIGAIDHEAIRIRRVGQQRHAEQPAFAVGRQVADREEQRLRAGRRGQAINAPGLFQHIDVAAARNAEKEGRLIKAGADALDGYAFLRIGQRDIDRLADIRSAVADAEPDRIDIVAVGIARKIIIGSCVEAERAGGGDRKARRVGAAVDGEG